MSCHPTPTSTFPRMSMTAMGMCASLLNSSINDWSSWALAQGEREVVALAIHAGRYHQIAQVDARQCRLLRRREQTGDRHAIDQDRWVDAGGKHRQAAARVIACPRGVAHGGVAAGG